MNDEPCACTLDAPCALHWAELPESDRRAWLEYLGLVRGRGHSPTERQFKKRRGGRNEDAIRGQ